MPVQHGLWKIGAPPERLSGAQLESEKQLEEMIVGYFGEREHRFRRT